MPRHSNKPTTGKDPKTGDDFIAKARSAGAHVSPARDDRFVKISTPQGSMYITPGNQTLDQRTRKNYKHWFRFLGLLGIILLCTLPIWGPIVGQLFFS